MSKEHHHSLPIEPTSRAFALGVALNTAFVVVEAAAGWMSGSLALIADAGHNLSDVATLLIFGERLIFRSDRQHLDEPMAGDDSAF